MSARWFIAIAALGALTPPRSPAAEPLRLRETFPAGEQYHVAIRE